MNSAQVAIKQDVIDCIKVKLSGQDCSCMEDWEWGVVNYLLDYDRDFIIAPDYGFSLNNLMEMSDKDLSIEEICKYAHISAKSIYRIQDRVIKRIYKNLGRETKVLNKKCNDNISIKTIEETIKKVRGRPKKVMPTKQIEINWDRN